MKRRAIVLVIALAVIVAAAVFLHEPVLRVMARTGNPLYDQNKSAWVWNATLISPVATGQTTPAASGVAAGQQLVNSLHQMNFDRIYLNVGWEKSVGKPFLEANPTAYDQFIKAASASGIAVEALYGEPSWARAENWAALEKHVNLVLDFNKTYHNRFSALHLDIEPYALTDYKRNEAALLKGYLTNVQRVKGMIEQHNKLNHDHLELVLDVPVWWDAKTPVVDGAALVPKLLQTADGLAVMNYTADAAKFVSEGKRWLEMAKTGTAKVSFGCEFQPNLKGATLSTFDDVKLTEYFKAATAEFHGNHKFSGFSIHHYEAFLKYREPSTTPPR